MLKYCKDCDEAFEARESYETRCFPCWKSWKTETGELSKRTAAPHIPPRFAAAREELKIQVDRLTVEVHRGKCDLERCAGALRVADDRLRVAEDRVRLLEHTLKCASDELERQRRLTGDLKGNLPRLIQLCHPDRHAGSTASHKATQWLVQQREVQS